MRRLTDLAHEACRKHLVPGNVAVDATVGNGHDTLFLAQAVGPTGHVYGFDIQRVAIASAQQRLQETDSQQVTLFEASHTEMGQQIPSDHHGRIRVFMFNLGYLPGGEKSITTTTTTTQTALRSACDILADDGLLSVIAYPGHDAGREETASVAQFLQQKVSEGWTLITHEAVTGSETAPRLYLLTPREA